MEKTIIKGKGGRRPKKEVNNTDIVEKTDIKDSTQNIDIANKQEPVIENTQTISNNPQIEESPIFVDDSPLLNTSMIEREYAMQNPADMIEGQTTESIQQPIAQEAKQAKSTFGSFEMGGEKTAYSEPKSNEYSDAPTEFSFNLNKDELQGGVATDSNGNPLESDNINMPEMPTQTAKQMADFFINTANFIIPLLGNRFVTIKIHPEYYEFNGFVQSINAQNEKNIERIKLSKEEQDYLKPILVAVLKEKHTQLSPMTQLMIAGGMIGVNKVATFIDIKRENRQLEDRLIELIRESRVVNKPEPKVTNEKGGGNVK
jgi:hypothetical protein